VAEGDDDSERSEDPTQKRLDQALERGDVVKSQEVNTWFILGAATLNILVFSASMSASLQTTLRGLIANAHAIRLDGGAMRRLIEQLGVEIVAASALPFLIFALAAIVGNMIQHRLVWSSESLTPKFSKISLIAGAKRLFSKQALANFVKGLVKLALVGVPLAALLWPQRFRLEGLAATDPAMILPFIRSLSLDLLATVVAILAVVAALDYLWQYRVWYERQKMSLREVKEEYKQTEGDPAIKARIRQIRQTRARKRMMAAVPKATVVVTNPTHYAVALKYERGMNAPLCLAKGTDAVALRIREVATAAGVPVVENAPLARTLHAAVEVDQEIPEEHYRAVAEVIGFVLRLKGRLAR
jgi:flagellar biosynthetic protein FlhB